MERRIEALVAWVLRRRWIVLGAIACLTVFFGVAVGRLKVAISSDDITPASHRYMKTMRDVRTEFGTEAPFIVIFTAEPGGEAAMLSAYAEFSRAIMLEPTLKHDSFRSLASRNTKFVSHSAEGIQIQGFLDNLPAEGSAALDTLAERLAASPTASKLFQSRDRKSLAMFAEFRDAASGYTAGHQRLLALMQKFRSEKYKIQLAGQNTILATIEGMSERMAFLIPLAILVIGLIHFESFRSIQAIVFPILTGIVASIWGVGAYSLSGFDMDPITALVPILILAVGAGHAVQVLKRYVERFDELAHEGSAVTTRELQNHAICDALASVGIPLLAAACIAIAAFLALTLFDTETVRRFGFLAAAGMFSIIAIEFTLIPILRSLLPPPGAAAASGSSIWGLVTATATRWAIQYPWRVVAGFCLAFGLALVGIAAIRLDNALRIYLSWDWPANLSNRFVDENFAGADGFYIFVEAVPGQTLRSASALRALAKVQDAAERDPHVTKTVSIVDLVSEIDAAVAGRPALRRKLPDSDAAVNDALALYEISAGPETLEGYASADFRYILVRGFTNTDRARDMKALEASLRAAIEKSGLASVAKVGIGGGSFGPISLSDALVPEKIFNIAVILASCFIVALVAMRSLWLALLCCAPLVISAGLVFGFLGWSQIPLMAPTATLGALCLGIGADYAIYMIWRLRKEAQHAGIDQAVANALNTSGRAVLFVASAITGGYAVLGLSFGYHVHQWMALLVGVAMMANAVAAVFFLPAVFKLLYRPRAVGHASPYSEDQH